MDALIPRPHVRELMRDVREAERSVVDELCNDGTAPLMEGKPVPGE